MRRTRLDEQGRKVRQEEGRFDDVSERLRTSAGGLRRVLLTQASCWAMAAAGRYEGLGGSASVQVEGGRGVAAHA